MSSVTNEELAEMMCRLFWLVRCAPGVATYSKDIEVFVGMEIKLGLTSPETGKRLIDQYKRADHEPED